MSENRLRHETSPYLLLHQDNPVHWHAWGPAAFEEAERLDKPILLSVGYAACHWCHVMARESFDNPEIAGLMNELFVNVKVDREERPDVDQVYMAALHAMGERGGWPLTMFLTPQRAPFWGGTYFPPAARFGRMGFGDVLRQIARVYRDSPDRIAENVAAIAAKSRRGAAVAGTIDLAALDGVAGRLRELLDPVNGGLEGAPKFPQASLIEFLWRAHDRTREPHYADAVELVLSRLCEGGIYDHIGGGFARYAVDEAWRVPHFEKMLYDNAQLLRLLSWAWRGRRNAVFKQRVEETIAWLQRDMAIDGAFAASLDADSERVEGKFYTWTLDEIEAVLGPGDAALFADAYGVTAIGNWEQTNVLNRLDTPVDAKDEARLAPLRRKLLGARAKRAAPRRDDKILADWNGLLIGALTDAAIVFERPDWLSLAEGAYRFVMDRMVRADRVGHSARLGRVTRPGLSSDAAFMIMAALGLHDATADTHFLDDARRMVRALDAHHWDDAKGYFFSADDAADLPSRPSGAEDDATPNANGAMAANLVRLGLLDGNQEYLDRADALFKIFGGAVLDHPFAHLGMMNAFDFAARAIEIVLVGPPDDAAAMLGATGMRGHPNLVVTRVAQSENLSSSHPAYGRPMREERVTAYVCRDKSCSMPVVSAEALVRLLAG